MQEPPFSYHASLDTHAGTSAEGTRWAFHTCTHEHNVTFSPMGNRERQNGGNHSVRQSLDALLARPIASRRLKKKQREQKKQKAVESTMEGDEDASERARASMSARAPQTRLLMEGGKKGGGEEEATMMLAPHSSQTLSATRAPFYATYADHLFFLAHTMLD